jgi:uncharacterized coiled-coil protein SlyX
MPTILELAQHAELPAETVLRVILREPTSEAAQRAVADAVAELGPPDYPRPNGYVEIVPDDREDEQHAELAVPDPAPAPALDEAVLAEVRNVVTPATEQVFQLRALLGEFVQRLKAERRERVEDLELMTELMVEGWKNVDRRLGRIEKVVSRLEDAQSAAPAAGRPPRTVVRLEDWVRQPFGETGPDERSQNAES